MRKTRRGDREEAELHDVLQATPHMPHVLPTELTAVYTRNTYQSKNRDNFNNQLKMSETGSMEEIHVEQTPTPTTAQLASKALMMESENLDVTN